jgi:hypothetical protein
LLGGSESSGGGNEGGKDGGLHDGTARSTRGMELWVLVVEREIDG